MKKLIILLLMVSFLGHPVFSQKKIWDETTEQKDEGEEE